MENEMPRNKIQMKKGESSKTKFGNLISEIHHLAAKVFYSQVSIRACSQEVFQPKYMLSRELESLQFQ